MQVHLFVSADLLPGRQSGGEGPAFDCEANAMEDGNAWVIGAPEGTRERVRVARWRGGRSKLSNCRRRRNLSDNRGGERFCLGEKEE